MFGLNWKQIVMILMVIALLALMLLNCKFRDEFTRLFGAVPDAPSEKYPVYVLKQFRDRLL